MLKILGRITLILLAAGLLSGALFWIVNHTGQAIAGNYGFDRQPVLRSSSNNSQIPGDSSLSSNSAQLPPIPFRDRERASDFSLTNGILGIAGKIGMITLITIVVTMIKRTMKVLLPERLRDTV
jgi:hypothetical protein